MKCLHRCNRVRMKSCRIRVDPKSSDRCLCQRVLWRQTQRHTQGRRPCDVEVDMGVLKPQEPQELPATTRSWKKLPLPTRSLVLVNPSFPRPPSYHISWLLAPERVEWILPPSFLKLQGMKQALCAAAGGPPGRLRVPPGALPGHLLGCAGVGWVTR